MTEPRHRVLLGLEALLLLLPLTLLTAAITVLSYPAYPIPLRPLQVIFDLLMLFKLAAIVASWRLIVRYLTQGRRGLRKLSPTWLVLLAIGALLGFLSGLLALWHMLNPETAPDIVGFILLSPAAVLVPIFLHLRKLNGAARSGL